MKAVAELIARVAGLLRDQQPVEALEIVRDEGTRVLGADPEVLAAVDERTVFVLLGDDPRRVARYARVLGLEADAREAMGETQRAATLRRRAASLTQAAQRRAAADEQK